MWENVTYRVETLDDPRIAKFLDEVRKVYVNGGVILRSFKAINEAEFDHSTNHVFSNADQRFAILMANETVRNSLVDPLSGISLQGELIPQFQSINLFTIEGYLTDILLTGGAYEKYQGTVDAARLLSRGFMEALFGENLHLARWGAISNLPWSSWFYDVIWDCTFLIQDRQSHRFVLICMTDTD